MSEKLQVVTLLGSLRKGSFNGMVARTLPKIAPASMEVNALPSIADIPLYDADVQQEAGKIHEHARIYRLRSVAGSQILNFMS
ncbi:putative NADPH-dependent FMN reductase [Escherichia coli]|nr:putative NADPH-dependent FMN reductase [Escherichia coli]